MKKKQKQKSFRVVEGSLEIENLAYNPLSQMLVVRNKASPERKMNTGGLALYDNYYGVPEEVWFEMLETPDDKLTEFITDRLRPIYKHIKGGD